MGAGDDRRAPKRERLRADAPPLQIDETNFRVRNCRLCHLKSLHPLGVLVVFLLATACAAAN